MQRPKIKNSAKGLIRVLKAYADVQSFISSTEGSYIFLALTGFVIQSFGFSPAIATVVATQALASVASKIALMIITNREEPFVENRYLTKNVGVLTTLIVSFGLFTVINKTVLVNPLLAAIQFTAGIIITLIGGASYRKIHKIFYNTDRHQAFKILLPGVTALTVVAFLLIGVEIGAEFLGLDEFLELIRQTEEVR